jgi:hypothetical protein
MDRMTKLILSTCLYPFSHQGLDLRNGPFRTVVGLNCGMFLFCSKASDFLDLILLHISLIVWSTELLFVCGKAGANFALLCLLTKYKLLEIFALVWLVSQYFVLPCAAIEPFWWAFLKFFREVSHWNWNLCLIQNSILVRRSVVNEWGGVFPHIPEEEWRG